MAQKLKPTGRQKSIFLVHLVVFLIASALMLTLYDKGAKGWVYPWPAWIVAAWGLSLIGHWCAVYTSYEDKGHDDYRRQELNG
ncbi:MAG: 2TM domain-containing protein [Sphingobacteriales bacterium]|nr:MAG: 2TM domain-containing protein [Sphingobacteriales bacterium]